MIKVTCDACGKSFGAKDELAGRTAKCPSCTAPIVIGAAATASPAPRAAARPAQAAAPRVEAVGASAPPPSAPVAGGSSSRRKPSRAGSSRGGSSRSGGKDYTTVTALALVAAIAIAVAGWLMSQETKADPYALGVEAKLEGDFEGAVAWFEKVEPSNSSYKRALVDLAEVREMLAARSANTERAQSEARFKYVNDLEAVWVVGRDGKGYTRPTYAPNARYMLKRAQEFLDDFPDDPRAEEIKKLMWRYSEVASLEKAPTEADVRAEIGFRTGGQFNWNMRALEEAVEEFVRKTPGDEQTARTLWNLLADKNDEFWQRTKSSQVDKWLGQGNWKAVAVELATYMQCYAGARRLSPDPEAVKLQAKAEAGGV